MKEIRDGIFLFNRELKNPSGKPLALVHPWFMAKYNKFILHSGTGNYISNLDILLRNTENRDVFLFEQDHQEQKSLDRVRAIRGDNGLYSIPKTSIGNSPFNLVIELIKEKYAEVDLAGGSVFDDPMSENKGCLGYTKVQLENQEIKTNLISGCCYTGSMNGIRGGK